MPQSPVSRLCADLDREGEPLRQRHLEEVYPYVWLDATSVKVRLNGRVVLTVGVRRSGEREVFSDDVGPSEEGAFWPQFLRSLVARGL
jgi:putative transposase